MVLYALEARLRDRYNTHYPSEEHLQKLKLNEDVLYPESFIAHPDMCSSIQNLKLNLRNRNIEIDVIVEHLKDPSMPERIKARDVKMLKDGIEYTLKRTSELIRKIDREVISSDIADYVNEKAARRRYDSQAYPGFASRVDKAFELMDKGEFKPYYTAENSQFIKALFPDNDPAKITEFLRLLNGNIFAMETGEGEIWLIPFNKNDAPIVKSMYGKTTD
ncbi:MAG: hypothetical protein K2L96_01970 [Muribaculaceae bacterium]|nr:hypothetical protein [Muribaculaceae bacterium]